MHSCNGPRPPRSLGRRRAGYFDVDHESGGIRGRFTRPGTQAVDPAPDELAQHRTTATGATATTVINGSVHAIRNNATTLKITMLIWSTALATRAAGGSSRAFPRGRRSSSAERRRPRPDGWHGSTRNAPGGRSGTSCSSVRSEPRLPLPRPSAAGWSSPLPPEPCGPATSRWETSPCSPTISPFSGSSPSSSAACCCSTGKRRFRGAGSER